MKKTKWLKYLIAFLVATAGTVICNGVNMDNDSWFVLAEGKEIVENGVYFEDQLSMHEGLEVTVQNYGFAVIFYLIYSMFGWAGVFSGMLVLNLLIVFLLYKICELISDKNINLSLVIAVVTDLLLAKWFIVTRAQVVSYVIMLLLIYLLELYVRKGKVKTLGWIPVLSVVQINLHASLWPVIPIILMVYVIDGLKWPKLNPYGYKKKPLLITLIASILVGFLNPYGFKMITFLLTSYGVPEANNYINEMKPFSFFSDYHFLLLYLIIVAALIMYIFAKKRKIKMRYLMMIFGFLAVGINSNKGLSQLILVLLFPLAEVYLDVRIEKWGSRRIWWMAASWAGIMATCMIVTSVVVRAPEMIDGPCDEMIEVMDKLDEETKGMDKKSLKLFVGYDQGGYAEYRGYKPYLDPRMEVFIKANNGKEDIFKEWYELEIGKAEKEEFLKKYDFDYLLVVKGESMYNLNEWGYEKIFEKDEGEGYMGVRVYKKVSM